MSTATRTQVMDAILAVIASMTFAVPVQGASAWVQTSNRLRLFGDVPSDQQPYACLVTHRERDEYRNLGLYRRRLELKVFVYVRTDAEPGQPMLDTIMESFEAAFNIVDNNSTGSNTLNGLVYWCRIEGQVFKDPGDLDNQAMMVVPLLVEMP